MSKLDDGGPAFPATERNEMHGMVGMSLRDYFAAKAMQGLIGLDRKDWQNVAPAAYQFADAMLKARES